MVHPVSVGVENQQHFCTREARVADWDEVNILKVSEYPRLKKIGICFFSNWLSFVLSGHRWALEGTVLDCEQMLRNLPWPS